MTKVRTRCSCKLDACWVGGVVVQLLFLEFRVRGYSATCFWWVARWISASSHLKSFTSIHPAVWYSCPLSHLRGCRIECSASSLLFTPSSSIAQFVKAGVLSLQWNSSLQRVEDFFPSKIHTLKWRYTQMSSLSFLFNKTKWNTRPFLMDACCLLQCSGF